MNEFDLMAKRYDTEERIKRGKAIADEIRLHIHDGAKKSAIEFGCGTGLVGIELINDFDSLLFIDSSSNMIEQVKQKLISLDKRSDSAICCDILTDTSRTLCADYIFTSLVLHHIQDTKAILSRLYNMLNSGGRLLIVDLDAEDGSFHAKYPDFDGHDGFEKSVLINSAESVGFSSVETKTFYHGKKTAGGKESDYSLFILDTEK